MVRAVHREARTQFEAVYPRALASYKQSIKMDEENWPDIFNSVLNTLLQDANTKANSLSSKLPNWGASVIRFGRKKLAQVFGSNTFAGEPWVDPLLRSWSLTNASLIKDIPERYVKDIAQLAAESVRQGRPLSEFTKVLMKRYRFTANRAELVARDQVGKLTGQVQQAQQERLGINEYRWRTMRDERVRTRHAGLEGKICRWDDPTVYRNPGETTWRSRNSIGAFVGHPGQDIGCRCGASALLPPKAEQLKITNKIRLLPE